MHIESGTTDDIVRHIQAGRINLGLARPVENIGLLRFFSIADERYLLAVTRENPLSCKIEIDIGRRVHNDDLMRVIVHCAID